MGNRLGTRCSGNPEISYLDTSAFADHDVVRFHIAVDDAVFVGVIEGVRYLLTDGDNLVNREGPFFLNAIFQCLSVNVLHHDVVDGIVFPYVPDEGRTTDVGAPIGNDVTSDLAVRRAVNLAADRTQLVEGVLGGYGSPATGPVDGAPYANPEAAIEDADPEGAARVLEEAGWRDADGDGVREKDGVEASFRILYPADDTVRQGLAVALADQVEAAGIRVEPAGASWEEIEQRMHAEPVMFGWGSHDPTEMYNLYSSRLQGVEYYNPGFYADEAVQSHLDEALTATDPEAADAAWRAAQLDEDGNGFSAAGDAAWAWLVNLDHTYYVDSCLDLGDLQTEPHGHGWPVTAGITGWSWSC